MSSEVTQTNSAITAVPEHGNAPAPKIFTDTRVQLDRGAGATGEYSYKLWKKENIRFQIPQTKELPPTAKAKGTYNDIPIHYEYGVDGKSDIRPMKIEGPTVNSYYGVTPVINKETGLCTGYSISCAIDPNNPEHARWRDIHHELYIETVRYICVPTVSSTVGIRGIKVKNIDKFTAQDFPENIIYPMYYKRTERGACAPIVPGARPILTPKVATGNYRSLFTDDSIPPREIPRATLSVSSIDHIPMISYAKVFCGGNPIAARIQMKLESTVVVEVKGRSNVSHQRATIEARQQARGDGGSSELEAQIAEIMQSVEIPEDPPMEVKGTPGQAPQSTLGGLTALPGPSSSHVGPPASAAQQPQMWGGAGFPQAGFPGQAAGYPQAGYPQPGYPQPQPGYGGPPGSAMMGTGMPGGWNGQYPAPAASPFPTVGAPPATPNIHNVVGGGMGDTSSLFDSIDSIAEFK